MTSKNPGLTPVPTVAVSPTSAPLRRRPRPPMMKEVAKQNRWHLLLAWVLLTSPGCRFSYELANETDPLKSEGAALGGANGNGDGDGDTGTSTGAGDGTTGGADGLAGGNGDGDMVSSGGTGAGGAASGGAATGGAATGGAATGGAATGGGATGGAATGGAATGGTGGLVGDYHVTSDAGDAGPGTFRNAIDQAIAAGTAKTITFDPDLTIVMDQLVPLLTSDLAIVGNNTHLDFSSAEVGFCFEVDSGTVTLDGLEVSGCGDNPIYFNGGTNHQVQNSNFHDNAGSIGTGKSSLGTTIGPGNRISNSATHCVFLNAPGDVVVDNEISNCGGNGIFFGGTSDGSYAIGNLIVRANAGIQFGSQASNITIRFNTITRSTGNGITIGQADQMTVQNNIITHSTGFGINGSQGNFTALSHNLYFSNTLANCNGCTPGTGAKVNVDPSYVNFASDDYRPAGGSPVIDAGLDTGENRNGGGGGNYWGTRPDLGYHETNY